MEILGLDHLYLAVRDFAASESFYDRVMAGLGFKKGDLAVGGAPHAHYFNRTMQLSIRPARDGTPDHDSYAPGLHHLCLQARTESDVDAVFSMLRDLGIEASPPARYPEYNPEYYATFFEDPDGIRLEVVARTSHRDRIVERWDDLEGFVNPVRRLDQRETGESDPSQDPGTEDRTE